MLFLMKYCSVLIKAITALHVFNGYRHICDFHYTFKSLQDQTCSGISAICIFVLI